MEKRKLKISLALVALAVGGLIAIQAMAADLHRPHVGSFCEAGPGEWHFVNNQTRGAAQGMLTAVFDDVGQIQVMAEKVNSNVQHFYISGPVGPLLSASTNLPGRLVLSDLECGPDCPPKESVCDDEIDNDCDGLVDCEDPDCVGNPACDCISVPEICDNGVDDDCDTFVDCDDPDCEGDPACACDPDKETYLVAGTCTDLIDNDCDTFVDCDDPDCEGDPACDCVPTGAEIDNCDDGIDNDCNGYTDCADGVNCKEDPVCL